MGDSIEIRGRSVYVEDLEARVAEVARLGKGRVVIVSVPGAGTRGLALFAETTDAPRCARCSAAGAVRTSRSPSSPAPA
jgi:fatty-acyl-CoA synthase